MASHLKCRASKSLTAPTEKKICLRWAVVVFAAVASLFMAVACGPTKKRGNEKGSATFVTTLPNEIAQRAYVNSALNCETPSGICPEAMALMVSRSTGVKDTDLFQCSSFLVGNDIVATNSHCIPPDLRLKGSQCSGRIQVVFGTTKAVLPATYDCDQVLLATEIFEDESHPEHGKRPDYAFIKLKQIVSKRKPLKFSRLGLQDDLKLNILAIDPSPNKTQVRGTLRLKKCVATQNSISAQNFTFDFAPIAAAAGCDTIKGNSGSPALDQQGFVRGILFAGSDNSELELPASIEAPAKYESTSILSNAACITVPERVIAPGAINPGCTAEPGTNVFQSVLNHTPLKADALYEAWKSQAPTMFGFEMIKSESPGSLNNGFPAVTCVQPLDRWAETPEKNADGTVTVTFEVPLWSQTQSLNSKLQARVATKQVGTIAVQMTVAIASLEKNEPTYVIESAKSSNGLVSRERKAHIPVCP